MKAKISPRISLDNRTKLETVIPLSTPYLLFIDPCNICNFKCRMCPNGNMKVIKQTNRVQTRMDFRLYREIIDNLQEFDKPLKVLRMYKEGEPLLNNHFESMIKYAKEKNIANKIDTTTNGFLFTHERSKSIIKSGIDKIMISVNGINEQQYYENTGVRLNFNRYVSNIRCLYENKKNCEIVIKIVGDYLTEKQKDDFYNIFGDICDDIFIENLAPCWNNFDVEQHTKLTLNKEKGIYGNELTNNIVCPYIFYSMSVNSDGSVSLCFLDWQRKLIIGNTKKQTLKEIWNSDVLYNYQMDNLRGKRKENEVCRDCGQLRYGMPDNVDPYANDIIEKEKLAKERTLNEWKQKQSSLKKYGN